MNPTEYDSIRTDMTTPPSSPFVMNTKPICTVTSITSSYATSKQPVETPTTATTSKTIIAVPLTPTTTTINTASSSSLLSSSSVIRPSQQQQQEQVSLPLQQHQQSHERQRLFSNPISTLTNDMFTMEQQQNHHTNSNLNSSINYNNKHHHSGSSGRAGTGTNETKYPRNSTTSPVTESYTTATTTVTTTLLSTTTRSKKCTQMIMTSHIQIFIICFLLFVVLTAAGVTVCVVIANSHSNTRHGSIVKLVEDTGKVFRDELDLALLPLFSLAQFATEIEIFSSLPERIGSGYEPGSAPFLPQVEGELSTSLLKRNVSGICDDPEVVERFAKIASTIESNTLLNNEIQTFQFTPYGVVCLAYTSRNTENLENGLYFDSSKVIGVDLLNDQANKYIAINSMIADTPKVSISGPKLIPQCPACGLYIIARLPVVSNNHSILVNGTYYNRWGFVTVLIQWENFIDRTNQKEKFRTLGYEFQLTRTDYIYNDTLGVFEKVDFVLAESDQYGTLEHEVSTALQTSNNEWVLKIQYNDQPQYDGIFIAVVVVVTFSIAVLVYCVLVQKQIHTMIVGQNLAQIAKLDIERNMTAYFAHELRNPLSAIDSALATMPCDDPNENEELISSMKLCSTFMATIMNNLLDVRKIEEGKLVLHSDPLSLRHMVINIGKMNRPTVRPGVKLFIECDVDSTNEWVLGDITRMNQILTNIVSNAVKYTLEGSIILRVSWYNEFVQFECEDTGPGIPKEEQSRMFERFVHRGGAPGTGLGLALVKQIVELMKGTIYFVSDPTIKHGTNCIVRLPLEPCTVPLSFYAHEAPSNLDVHPFEELLRILIVDDIKMNRVMLKRRLQKDVAPFCDIVEASTGEEAIKICENGERPFDIIIMDQYMEEAGGILVGTDAIIALRRMKVPSIIIGCSGNDLTHEFMAAGADLVWCKPMPTNKEMIQQLRTFLQDKHDTNQNVNQHHYHQREHFDCTNEKQEELLLSTEQMGYMNL